MSRPLTSGRHRRFSETFLGMLELIARLGIEFGRQSKRTSLEINAETSFEFNPNVCGFAKMATFDIDMLKSTFRRAVRRLRAADEAGAVDLLRSWRRPLRPVLVALPQQHEGAFKQKSASSVNADIEFDASADLFIEFLPFEARLFAT